MSYLVGQYDSYLKGYQKALNDFHDRISEHTNNGHRELAAGWLFHTLEELKVKVKE